MYVYLCTYMYVDIYKMYKILLSSRYICLSIQKNLSKLYIIFSIEIYVDA